mmetsp:Transcript_11087/g.32819  ORF Transcript_11087/g.32819 Transcript_11087/m.32819 type:complete len:255 (+) Transcript_11087:585-1349(+)
MRIWRDARTNVQPVHAVMCAAPAIGMDTTRQRTRRSIHTAATPSASTTSQSSRSLRAMSPPLLPSGASMRCSQRLPCTCAPSNGAWVAGAGLAGAGRRGSTWPITGAAGLGAGGAGLAAATLSRALNAKRFFGASASLRAFMAESTSARLRVARSRVCDGRKVLATATSWCSFCNASVASASCATSVDALTLAVVRPSPSANTLSKASTSSRVDMSSTSRRASRWRSSSRRRAAMRSSICAFLRAAVSSASAMT